MKKRALDRAYEEIDAKYKNMKEEDIKKEIDNLEKEMVGKLGYATKLQGEDKTNAENEIAKINIKTENLRGYLKNKNQIEKILEVRGQLETKLTNVTKAKQEAKKEFNKAKKELEKVNKVLANEKKTMKMDQNEYNDLLIKKENAEKEMKFQKESFEKSDAKIEEIESKIGKCNLAWRTLFTNKTWDDIQLRATESKSRFIRKKDEEDKLEEKQEEIQQDEKENENLEQEQEQVEDTNKGEISNLPAKVTAWTKIKNFFKSIPTKIKATFGMEDGADKTEKQSQNDTKEQSDTKEQRDEFLEGLRRHVDVDYRDAIRKTKEQQYIEQHSRGKNENEK